MSTTIIERSEVKTKADDIYKNVVRPQLTQTDKGKYLYIHTGNGEWIVDEDDLVVTQKAKARWGTNQPLFFMRIGYRAAYSFRIGIDLELADW